MTQWEGTVSLLSATGEGALRGPLGLTQPITELWERGRRRETSEKSQLLWEGDHIPVSEHSRPPCSHLYCRPAAASPSLLPSCCRGGAGRADLGHAAEPRPAARSSSVTGNDMPKDPSPSAAPGVRRGVCVSSPRRKLSGAYGVAKTSLCWSLTWWLDPLT